MILYPPEKFDANEWFIIIVSIGAFVLIYLLPKRFTALTILVIWIFNFCLAQATDFDIGRIPIELYKYNDSSKYEIFDLFLYIFTYPPAAYFCLYFYDKWKPTGWLFAGYILLFPLFTTGMEWVSLQFHVYEYKGWKLYYSFVVYIFVYLLNVGLLRFVQHYLNGREQYHLKRGS